jgi:hypothetical protein
MTIEVVYKTSYGYLVKVIMEDYNYDTSAWEVADISGFSTLLYKFERPNGTVVNITPEFETDGVDGSLVYTITEDDNVFTLKGQYQLQVKLTSVGQDFYSTKYRFKVDSPLGSTS